MIVVVTGTLLVPASISWRSLAIVVLAGSGKLWCIGVVLVSQGPSILDVWWFVTSTRLCLRCAEACVSGAHGLARECMQAAGAQRHMWSCPRRKGQVFGWLPPAPQISGFSPKCKNLLEDSQSWDCTDVPLPTLPATLTQTLELYTACAVSGTTGNQLDACDSRYGGVVPGVHILPEKHQLATMVKTARIQATLSVDVPLEETLFVKSELEVEVAQLPDPADPDGEPSWPSQGTCI